MELKIYDIEDAIVMLGLLYKNGYQHRYSDNIEVIMKDLRNLEINKVRKGKIGRLYMDELSIEIDGIEHSYLFCMRRVDVTIQREEKINKIKSGMGRIKG